jgi:hypothetical protein
MAGAAAWDKSQYRRRVPPNVPAPVSRDPLGDQVVDPLGGPRRTQTSVRKSLMRRSAPVRDPRSAAVDVEEAR